MSSRAGRDWVVIDGGQGEGGGQIVRTALTLSAISGRSLLIEHIRALRRKPGLAAQHLSAVRATSALCAARVEGDALGSSFLKFEPAAPVAAGEYVFDVGLAREGGSAGAVMLVLQTILLPLTRATGSSHLVVRGGTHVPWSPPFDFLDDAWLPMLRRLGVDASLQLQAWGWYPIGKGEVIADIAPGPPALLTLELDSPGPMKRIRGRAVASRLPAHIPERMAERARSLLMHFGVELEIEALRIEAACAGAGIFLAADYANLTCGFSAMGRRGKTSEEVAAEAAGALVRHHASGAALDSLLADQMLVPLCLAGGPSHFSVEKVTGHVATNAWVIERFGAARIAVEDSASGLARVTVTPTG